MTRMYLGLPLDQQIVSFSIVLRVDPTGLTLAPKVLQHTLVKPCLEIALMLWRLY